MKLNQRAGSVILTGLAVITLLAACQSPAATPSAAAPSTTTTSAGGRNADRDTLVIYSGRSENLVGPLIDQYKQATGVDVEVRYGNTAEMAATILEEGVNSPADVFFGQDAGSLGALAQAGRLAKLPDTLLDQVDARYRSPRGEWIGTSGRARVLAYNTELVNEGDLPTDAFGLTDAKWKGKVGWAPANASFQSFVTAMRKLHGDDVTRQWLEDMLANDVQTYDDNPPIVDAVGKGEILAGLTNHYYLYRFLKEQGETFPARNHYFPDGGADALINVAGAGVVNSSKHPEAAQQFIEFLVSAPAQQYFADETVEYPLAGEDITINPLLKPLSELNPPQIDLSDLSDLQGTLDMLQETGALQ